MLNEQDVLAAKFWRLLEGFRKKSLLTPTDYFQFTLCVIALHSIRGNGGRHPDEFRKNAGQVLQFLVESSEINFNETWKQSIPFFESLIGPYSGPFVIGKNPSYDDFNRLTDGLSFSTSQFGEDSLLIVFFDEVFYRIVSELSESPYRFGDSAAILAAYLASRTAKLHDYFTTTAEFMVQVTLNRIVTGRKVSFGVSDRIGQIVALRLGLYGVRCDRVSLDFDSFNHSLSERFILIDHPNRRASLNGTRYYGIEEILSRGPTGTLDTLRAIVDSNVSFSHVLAVVPGRDRTERGWKADFRRSLVATSPQI